MESQNASTSLQSAQATKERKKRSRCWESFIKLLMNADGKSYAKCTKCGKELVHSTSMGTKNLVNHHDSCGGLSISPRSAISSSMFNHDRFRELLIKAIIKHDLPFSFVEYEGIHAAFDYVSPELHLSCRNTVKNHITRMFESEKVKVRQLLSKAKGRICLTSDLWSSHTSDGYVSLTAHFLDNEWSLHKKILNFCHMPPPHTGSALVEKINTLICDWGIDKNLFSITLDNASANDSFMEKLKTQLNFRGLLVLNGNFFHVRCCAHILNLIVPDVLKVIDESVTKVRDCVKYIKGSIARKHKFLECVQHVGLMGNRRALKQDVPTRWNSTFLMLDSALYYRQVIGQYALLDADFKTCPTPEEWERIGMISKFLGEFYEVTTLFSGNKYVTSNLFFPRIFKIQYMIQQAMIHEHDFMKQMGKAMSLKFNKYWSDYSLILGIAVVMDPRFKMKFVEWAFTKLYPGDSYKLVRFRDDLYSLFDAYMVTWSTETSSTNQFVLESSYSQDDDVLFQDFDSSCNDGTSSSVKNELTSYLEDKRLDRKIELDVLSWWRTEQIRYPILSRLAGDILMIPVTTVASESAFSIGGRVLDQYRSTLLPETVQALLCVRDWLYDKKYKGSHSEDLLAGDILDMNDDQGNEHG